MRGGQALVWTHCSAILGSYGRMILADEANKLCVYIFH